MTSSRRDFLQQSAASVAGLSLPLTAPAALPGPPADIINVTRAPDNVLVRTEAGNLRLRPDGEGRWSAEGVAVSTIPRGDALAVALEAPDAAVIRLRLRWWGPVRDTVRVMGDAWERGYGDLAWCGLSPDRVFPWYLAVTDGARTHAYGVRTGAGAFCWWQLDARGLVLHVDARSGGTGVRLGARRLDACAVTCRTGREGESAHAALRAFCRDLCPAPVLPAFPVYGANDWYWAYGKNSADSVRDDAARIVELSPAVDNRPFMVIDDGWQPGRGADEAGAGTWDRGNEKFPDMALLAADIRRAGARPGIWIRPLEAPKDAPDGWRLSRARGTLDPTVPEVAERVAADMARVAGWGYELIKHDYSTWDIFGRWGFQMGSALTTDGWRFAEGPTRTTAEVIDELYRRIAEGAGRSLVLGCNTVTHLSAGRFALCRIGDDTSGSEWPRTRKMGVNSLAFRGVQHGAFYAADPDCVGVTLDEPWALNRQWLDLAARSGTMLWVSIAVQALGAEQRRDVARALAVAAAAQPLGEPLDWTRTTHPTHWRLQGREQRYDWIGNDEGEDA